MSKTAIEQILDFMQKKSSEKIDTDYGELFALTISKSCELLEVEKQQIIDAYNKGNREEFYDGTETQGEQYYTQTFTENLKQ